MEKVIISIIWAAVLIVAAVQYWEGVLIRF